MDAYKSALEGELHRFAEGHHGELLKVFRDFYASPHTSNDPFDAFCLAINATNPAKQMDQEDAMKGGISVYLHSLLGRLTPPQEFAQVLANNKKTYARRIVVRKAIEMIKFTGQQGMTEERIQTKKAEVGWGKEEEDEMKRQIDHNRLQSQ